MTLQPIHAETQSRFFGATQTIARATDNAPLWVVPLVGACVISGESITAVLDSATQLITVIIILMVIRTSRRGRH